MRSAVRGALAGLVLLALLGAVAARAGWIETAVPRPQGTGAWMFSRVTGLLAYLALGLEVFAGLLVSTRSGDRWLPRGQLVDLHGWLSPLALALVLAHGAVLLADRHVRFDVIDVLVPFASSRWPFAIGLGVVGAYLLLVVHLSFGLRKRIGTATWRRLHYLSFVAFVLVTIHALAVGTDRANPWFAAVYLVMLVAVASLVARRLWTRRERRRPPVAGSTSNARSAL
ncbi:MAG: ferric reductase [Deltaproteobacteria bacterium]|nr:ferric reductase [Kofleriaceae bacterium]